MMLAHEQGWGDLSIHANVNLQTPAIDSIARDGALFERFFVGASTPATREGAASTSITASPQALGPVFQSGARAQRGAEGALHCS
jgi:hypothetical protein